MVRNIQQLIFDVSRLFRIYGKPSNFGLGGTYGMVETELFKGSIGNGKIHAFAANILGESIGVYQIIPIGKNGDLFATATAIFIR